jgi:hypothetical protein
MPASREQTEYISDLFEQLGCDENEVADMLEEVVGLQGGVWPRDALDISWSDASELIEELKDHKRDHDRPSGRRERGRG